MWLRSPRGKEALMKETRRESPKSRGPRDSATSRLGFSRPNWQLRLPTTTFRDYSQTHVLVAILPILAEYFLPERNKIHRPVRQSVAIQIRPGICRAAYLPQRINGGLADAIAREHFRASS